MAAAVKGRTAVRQRKPTPNPHKHAAPTTTVIAISTAENVPETTWANPARYSQIRAMIPNQNTRHGSAAHLPSWLPRQPNRMGPRSGRVCTACRSTPWLTAPTTRSATGTVAQHAAIAGGPFRTRAYSAATNCTATGAETASVFPVGVSWPLTGSI